MRSTKVNTHTLSMGLGTKMLLIYLAAARNQTALG